MRRARRVFSGIQPTGDLHVGNYFGAIHNWTQLMDADPPLECIYSIVDLHSLSSPQMQMDDHDDNLYERTRRSAACLIAAGVDPERCTLYRQSDLGGRHAQLMWVLSSLVPLGRLSRMTQFKDKAAGGDEDAQSLALFSYPVLQAADIMLFRGDVVPVGEDQRQHIEMARFITKSFNKKTKMRVPVPKGLYSSAPKIRSLADPSKKMSKSSGHKGVLFFTDSDEDIEKKIRRAVTDSDPGISWNMEERPGVTSLLLLDSLIRDESEEEILERHAGSNKAKLKDAVTRSAIDFIAPIRSKIDELMTNPAHLDTILRQGRDKAYELSKGNFYYIMKAAGLKA